jgi:hypothetical protein
MLSTPPTEIVEVVIDRSRGSMKREEWKLPLALQHATPFVAFAVSLSPKLSITIHSEN